MNLQYKVLVYAVVCCIFSTSISAQSTPIVIDGEYEDWSNTSNQVVQVYDGTGEVSGVDIEYLEASNDEDALFVHLVLDKKIDLTGDDFSTPSDVKLYIDADNNPNTGFSTNGIGMEYLIDFQEREVRYYYAGNNYDFISLYELGMIVLPTVTSNEFELSLQRVFNGQLLFENEISMVLVESSSGDKTDVLNYSFSGSFEDVAPIILDAPSAKHIRVLTYNTLFDGLLDNSRVNSFKRILASVKPDIIHFNEVYDTPALTAKNVVTQAIGGTWYAYKHGGENITVSKYEILETFNVYDNRVGACLLDLPDDEFDTDIVAVVGHLSCCDNDSDRQKQSDAFIEFWLKVKNGESSFEVEENTPMFFSGDMNFVGLDRQLETILEGDILYNNIYGPDGSPDWDGGDLMDLNPRHTHLASTHTWRDLTTGPGSYPPGRLDFMFFTPSGLNPLGAYVLDTQTIPSEVIDEYSILPADTYVASDHLPIIADFELAAFNSTQKVVSNSFLKLFPNPSRERITVELDRPIDAYSIYDLNGQRIESNLVNNDQLQIEVSHLKNGLYEILLYSGDELVRKKFIKI